MQSFIAQSAITWSKSIVGCSLRKINANVRTNAVAIFSLHRCKFILIEMITLIFYNKSVFLSVLKA